MKVCTGCQRKKGLSEYHKKGDGYQAQCKLCRTAYDRKQYRENPTQRAVRKASVERYKVEFRQWYNSLKIDKPCTDCGISFHFAAMHWDHLPEFDKERNLAKLVNIGSKQRVLNEIAKCELVCANCHAIRTYQRTYDIRAVSGSNPVIST